MFGLKFDKHDKTYVIINGKKRYVVIDPSHEIKNIKNALTREVTEDYVTRLKKIKFIDDSGNVYTDADGEPLSADFEHVRQLYHMDNDPARKGLKLQPNLTKEMVYPNNFTAQRVRNAVVPLSKTTHDALVVLEADGRISGSKPMSELALFFNNWHDRMNSRCGDKVPNRKPITFENDVIHDLQKDRDRIVLWKSRVLQKERIPNQTLNNVIFSTNSVIALSLELLTLGYDYVQTRRFNNDMQEFFFFCCRRLGGSSTNPTIENMLSIYRILAFHSMQKVCEKPGMNVEASLDMESIVGSVNVMELSKQFKRRLDEARLLLALSEPPIVFPEESGLSPVVEELDEIVQRVVYYLSGFASFRTGLAAKLCDTCQAVLFSVDISPESAQFTEWTRMRDRGGLHHVGPALYEIFLDLELLFCNWIDSCLYERPRETLLAYAEQNGTMSKFLALKERSSNCTGACCWVDIFREIAGYYIRIRIHFYTVSLNEKIGRKGSRGDDFQKRKLNLLTK